MLQTPPREIGFRVRAEHLGIEEEQKTMATSHEIRDLVFEFTWLEMDTAFPG
jgi:hypothetical protein